MAEVAIVIPMPQKFGTGDRGHSCIMRAHSHGSTGEWTLICRLLYTRGVLLKVLEDAEETLNKSGSREDLGISCGMASSSCSNTVWRRSDLDADKYVPDAVGELRTETGVALITITRITHQFDVL